MYGLIGWAAEIVWTGVTGLLAKPDRKLPAHTNLWMFPIYGLIVFLFEPLHNFLALNHIWWVIRGLVYATGFIVIETITGELIRLVTRQVPWDYTGRTIWHIRGVTRFDYAILWFAFGLALESIHWYLINIPSFRG